MSTYYTVCCDERREQINVCFVLGMDGSGFGIKQRSIAAPGNILGALAIFALNTIWTGKSLRLADDIRDHDPGYFDYHDITPELIVAYNKEYKTSFEMKF